MSDPLLLVVVLVLVIAVPFDWLVAVMFIVAAIEKPYIGVLTLGALRSIAIAVAASFAALVGINGVWFSQTGQRLLPVPWGTVLLAVTLVIISLPNIYALRLLRDGRVE